MNIVITRVVMVLLVISNVALHGMFQDPLLVGVQASPSIIEILKASKDKIFGAVLDN